MNTQRTDGGSVTVALPDFLDTPENHGAMASLQAKSELQGCPHFFDDPIHIRRDLMRKGSAAGWNTPYGHTASNIIEILQNLFDYQRPAWATDERQTLPYFANQQIERLAGLSAMGE